MIGRKAMGYPNIFAKLTGKKPEFGFNEYLELALKYKICFAQLKSQAIFFTKYREGASEMRTELSKAKKFAELKKILSE